jgi:hypothetical protein
MLPRRRWEDIKQGLKETGRKDGNWIHLAHDTKSCRAFSNTEMNLQWRNLFLNFEHQLIFLKQSKRFGNRLCYRLHAGKARNPVDPLDRTMRNCYRRSDWKIALPKGSTRLGVFIVCRLKQRRLPKRRASLNKLINDGQSKRKKY